MKWRWALALLASCGGSFDPPITPARARGAEVHVTHVRGDRFRVDYTFPEPTTSLTFVLPSPVVRAKWRAASDEMKLVRADGVDTLIAPEPRSRWAIELDVDEVQPEKDYRTFYRLADRGLLLYTGHLAAVPTGAPPKDPMRLVLTAAEGESVLIHEPKGNAQGQEVTAIALPGTYAYFGSLKPIETRDFIGVVDRGFPPVLRDRLDELVPSLFASYAETLGRPPSAGEKPLLFASFHELSYAGRDMGGGVMPPRVINLDVGLPAGTPSEETMADLEQIIAHEVAHLWNVDLYSVSPTEHRNTAWLREGGAEAVAFETLRRLGRLQADAYEERYSTAVSLCLLSLAEGEPLSASTRRGHARDFYNCGATIALLTAVSIKGDLLPFYRDVFDGPNGHYDLARYYAMLEERSSRQTADFVRRLADERLDDPVAEIPAALLRAGVSTRVSPTLPRAYEAQAGAAAIRALVAPACAAALAIHGSYGGEVQVTADRVCGEAARGDVLRTFAGVDIAQKGATAFDSAYKQCVATKSIEVERAGKPSVRLPCAESPRPRPPYYAASWSR